jgi:hypothetical protein
MTTCELTSWHGYYALFIVGMSSIPDTKFACVRIFLKAKLPGFLAIDHVKQKNYSNSDLLKFDERISFFFRQFNVCRLKDTTSLETFTYR